MSFPNVTDIIATTIESRNGEVADNVTNNNAVLAYIKKSGNVKPITGGRVIFEELSFAQNGNASWYAGYDTLPTGAQDVISSAQFDIKQIAAPVSISGLEMLQNSGKQEIIDLLDARLEVAEATVKNLIVQGIYSNGTGYGGKQITGLQAALTITPTTGVYGLIDRSVWSFWRNQKFQCTVDGTGAATALNIGPYMNSLYAKCVRGTDMPDLVVMDNNYWSLYTASLQTIQRFSSPDVGDLGFQTLKFMGADVVFDNVATGIPASTMYMLNTKYLKFRPHANRNMVTLDPGKRYSVNQDAQVQMMAWAGNMTASGSLFHGIMSN